MGLFKKDKRKSEIEKVRNETIKSDIVSDIIREREKAQFLVEMVVDSIREGKTEDVQEGTRKILEGNIGENADKVRFLVLKEKIGNRYLPIWIGPNEADSIAVVLQGIAVPRPLTHDIISNLVRLLGISIENVIISDFKNDCYFACINIDGGGARKINLDCRPSDAINVAIRTGAPVYASKDVMNKVSVVMDSDKPQ